MQSLSTNVEILSAIANDNGYENVFEFQLQSNARRGDVLVAVSSSGRSPNIVRALEWCAENDVETVALTGFLARAQADRFTAPVSQPAAGLCQRVGHGKRDRRPE